MQNLLLVFRSDEAVQRMRYFWECALAWGASGQTQLLLPNRPVMKATTAKCYTAMLLLCRKWLDMVKVEQSHDLPRVWLFIHAYPCSKRWSPNTRKKHLETATSLLLALQPIYLENLFFSRLWVGSLYISHGAISHPPKITIFKVRLIPQCSTEKGCTESTNDSG